MDSRGTRRPAGGRLLPLLVAAGVALLVLGACSGSASDRTAPDRTSPVANHASTTDPQPRDDATPGLRFALDLTDGIPSGFWRAKPLEVQITNSNLVEAGSELTLRKSWLA